MALSSSEALKSRAAGLVLHMREEPVSGGGIYLILCVVALVLHCKSFELLRGRGRCMRAAYRIT
jgi:hypothetical protein